MITPTTTDNRDAVLSFVARLQKEPRTACAYLSTLEEDVVADLDGLDQPFLETTRVLLEDGRIVGAACIEWDEEVGRAWLHGPWLADDVSDDDADALVAAVVALAPVDDIEMYADVANEQMTAQAERLGWLACEETFVFTVARAAVARPDDAVYPAGTGDLAALDILHAAAFPNTYASARELVEGEEYTILALAEGGELLGYVAGKPDGNDVYLDFVAVAPHARRRGLGTRLIGALAATLPGDNMRLTVNGTATEAIALYEGSGWERRSATRAYRRR